MELNKSFLKRESRNGENKERGGKGWYVERGGEGWYKAEVKERG